MPEPADVFSPLSPHAVTGGPLNDLLVSLNQPFDTAMLREFVAGVTPDGLASFAQVMSLSACLAYLAIAFFGRSPRLPRALPTSVLVVSGALGYLSLSGLVPMNALVVSAPIILQWAVLFGALPGVGIGKAMRIARGENEPAMEDAVARGVLKADTFKAINEAVRDLSPARARLLNARCDGPLSWAHSSLHAALDPVEAAQRVRDLSHPNASTGVEYMAAWARDHQPAAVAVCAGCGFAAFIIGGPVLLVLVAIGGLAAAIVGGARDTEARRASAENALQ